MCGTRSGGTDYCITPLFSHLFIEAIYRPNWRQWYLLTMALHVTNVEEFLMLSLILKNIISHTYFFHIEYQNVVSYNHRRMCARDLYILPVRCMCLIYTDLYGGNQPANTWQAIITIMQLDFGNEATLRLAYVTCIYMLMGLLGSNLWSFVSFSLGSGLGNCMKSIKASTDIFLSYHTF